MASRYVVTANRVRDGAVVYLGVDRSWALGLRESHRTDTELACEGLLAWAKTQERDICDPYVLEVTEDGDRVSAPSMRERIRAEGPEVVLARLGYGRTVKPVLHAVLEPKRSA